MRLFRLWPASALVVLLTAGACHRQPAADSASRFAPTPPTIDGRDDDWENDLLVYDANSKLQYRIANDAHTVYVRIKAADPTTQRRLLLQGFTVWLDTTGRSQPQLGVRYPLGTQGAGRMPGTLPRRPDADGPTLGRDDRLAQLLAGMNEMELLNYKGSKEPTLTDTKSPLGVQAAAAFDAQDNLIYELAVPLRLLYRHVPDISGKHAPIVGVTFAGAKPTTPAGSSGGGSRGGMGGGGMRGGGGMGGGGMRGGGGMGGGGMRGGGGMGRTGGGMQSSAYSKPISLKTSVELTAK